MARMVSHLKSLRLRTLFQHLSLLLLLSLGLALSACANKPADPNAPVTPQVTMTPQEIATKIFNVSCAGLPVADISFQAVRVFSTNVIDDNAVKWESAVFHGWMNRCAGPAPDVSSYEKVVKEMEADIAQIMAVVVAAKNNPPGG